MTKPIVIHRDHTFVFNGRKYEVIWGTDRYTPEWDGYTIVAVLSDRPGDYTETGEIGHWSMGDVRAMLARAQEEGWEYIADLDGNDLHAKDIS